MPLLFYPFQNNIQHLHASCFVKLTMSYKSLKGFASLSISFSWCYCIAYSCLNLLKTILTFLSIGIAAYELWHWSWISLFTSKHFYFGCHNCCVFYSHSDASELHLSGKGNCLPFFERQLTWYDHHKEPRILLHWPSVKMGRI